MQCEPFNPCNALMRTVCLCHNTDMEKRRDKRYLRQVSVRFGEEAGSRQHVGFTFDLSKSGILLKSGRIYSPPTRLFLELSLCNGKNVLAEGVVQWAKRVPPAMARVIQKHGMGIRFINVPIEYEEFIDTL